MTNITAEQFSIENHAAEVTQVVDLVTQSYPHEHLAVVRPDTLERFSGRARASESIGRIMAAGTMVGGPIRSDGRMVGLWTMVADLRIKHPGRPLGLLVGDEIDYWADLGSVEEHVVATEAVLAHTRTRRALAILSKEEADWAPGIPVLMTAVGAPGEVKLPLSARLFGADYGLTGRPGLQVYTHDRTEA